MAELIRCSVCHKRVSSAAAREIKGRSCCPPCYAKLSATLQQRKSERRNTARGPRRPMAASEKLAVKAGRFVGRGIPGVTEEQPGPAAPPRTGAGGVPDMPDFLGGGRVEELSRQQMDFSLSPTAIGLGAYLMVMTAVIYTGCRLSGLAEQEKPGLLSFVVLLAVMLAGGASILFGIMDTLKGGERRKQIAGGLAIAFSLGIMLSGGPAFVRATKGVPNLSEIVEGQDHKQPPEEPAKPKTANKPKTKPKAKPKTNTTKTPGTTSPTTGAGQARKPKLSEKVRKDQEDRRNLITALAATAREALAANKSLGELAFLQKRFVKVLKFAEKAGLVTGNLVVDRGRSFKFEATRSTDGFRINWIVLPETASKAFKDSTKGWISAQVPSDNPVIRFERAIHGLDLPGIPSSLFAERANKKLLINFGVLVRSAAAAPLPICDGARGVIAELSGESTCESLLKIAKKYPGPLAILVRSQSGLIYHLPSLDASVPNTKFKPVELQIVQIEGKFAFRLDRSTIKDDAKCPRRIINYLRDIHKLSRRKGDMCLRITPHPDLPLTTLLRLLDYARNAKFPLAEIRLNPPAPVKSK
jgi:hypothetical protein